MSIGMIIWFVISSYFLLALAAMFPSVAAAFFLIWFLISFLPLLLRIMNWRNTFYALTDQRMLMGSGAFSRKVIAVTYERAGGMIDYATYRITGTYVSQGYLGRMSDYGTVVFITNRGNVFWKCVRHPLDLRKFIEETVKRAQYEEHVKNVAVDAAVNRAAQISVDQQYGILPKTGAQTRIQIPPIEAQPLPSQASAEVQKIERIEKLKSLLDSGVITREEYDSLKRRVLQGQGLPPIEDQLVRLRNLYDSGAITAEEYETEKRRLIEAS